MFGLVPSKEVIKKMSNEELISKLLSAAVDDHEMQGFAKLLEAYRNEILERLSS